MEETKPEPTLEQVGVTIVTNILRAEILESLKIMLKSVTLEKIKNSVRKKEGGEHAARDMIKQAETIEEICEKLIDGYSTLDGDLWSKTIKDKKLLPDVKQAEALSSIMASTAIYLIVRKLTSIFIFENDTHKLSYKYLVYFIENEYNWRSDNQNDKTGLMFIKPFVRRFVKECYSPLLSSQ